MLETADNAEIFIYKGSNRDEAESLIEFGDKLYPGNPLRFKDLEDLFIVFRKTVNGQSISPAFGSSHYETFDGSFSLTYEVEGP